MEENETKIVMYAKFLKLGDTWYFKGFTSDQEAVKHFVDVEWPKASTKVVPLD